MSKSEQIEQYFKRESEHDNAHYFLVYTKTKESKLFNDLEIPLIIFDKAIELFIDYHDKPLQAGEKYMELLNEYQLDIPQKVFVTNMLHNYIGATEFPNERDPDGEALQLYEVNCIIDIENRLLENSIKVSKPTGKQQQANKTELGIFTNSQLILIFYYFFKQSGLTPRESIDIAPIAKFIHLITGKVYKNVNNSDFYKKLKTAPNFKTDKYLISDLETIRPLFQKVELSEVVKMIDNEIDMARNEVNKTK